MPYNYIPYCVSCGAEGESETLASEKNSHGDFLVQTLCGSCGTPISVVKAELQPDRKYKYEPGILKTPRYFRKLSTEELISEMQQLGRHYFQWEMNQETQGPTDPELHKATARCAEEIRRRIRLAEPKFVGDTMQEVMADGTRELLAPAER